MHCFITIFKSDITTNVEIRTDEYGETIYIIRIQEESRRMDRELRFHADDIIHLKRDVCDRRYLGGTSFQNNELLTYARMYESLHDNLQKAVKLIPNVSIESIDAFILHFFVECSRNYFILLFFC